MYFRIETFVKYIFSDVIFYGLVRLWEPPYFEILEIAFPEKLLLGSIYPGPPYIPLLPDFLSYLFQSSLKPSSSPLPLYWFTNVQYKMYIQKINHALRGGVERVGLHWKSTNICQFLDLIKSVTFLSKMKNSFWTRYIIQKQIRIKKQRS